MKSSFILFRRGGMFYCENTATGKQQSLRTKDAAEAQTLLHSKNEAARQPFLNLRIAQTYLAAADPQIAIRTWGDVIEEFIKAKVGRNRERVERGFKEAAFDSIRSKAVVETQADQFLRVLEKGSVSTNIYLRRLHNFALGMNWLPWPVLPKKQWPAVRHGQKRAITHEEHAAILLREKNTERRAFYQYCVDSSAEGTTAHNAEGAGQGGHRVQAS
jgi:hypothetical protein